MNINPVLKNETKLAVRSFKFTLIIFFYVALLAAGALFIFYANFGHANVDGINLESIVFFYTGMAIIQAILLMFIVPSLTATAICAEREKQTLEVLLSTKMSTLSIISGKLLASISRVIVLIICTMPVYSIVFLVGGVNLVNILELCLFFIVTTIFVGALGVCVSTFVKTSRVATAVTYGITLAVYLGIMIVTVIVVNYSRSAGNPTVEIPRFAYLSPTFGFISLLANQIGDVNYVVNFFGRSVNGDSFNYGSIISIVIQLVISVMSVLLASYKLNPLNKGIKLKKRKKTKESK